MSMTKLTLSADREIIRKARQLAKKNNTSISALFSRLILLASGRRQGKEASESIGPLTREALGMIRLPAGKSDRALLEQSLLERYGIKS